jgi:hypothetical protein
VESMTQVQPRATQPRLPALWTGILAGPIAWACDEVIGYTITAHECSTGSMRGLNFLTLASLCLCVFGWICAKSVDHDRHSERQRVMALAGMVLSIAFAVAILATGIPRWMLGPCD